MEETTDAIPTETPDVEVIEVSFESTEYGQPNWTESRTIFDGLTDERRRILSDELVHDTLELESTKQEKKDADAGYNSVIKSLESRTSRKAKTLEDGKEDSPVRVGWWVNYDAGVKVCRRLDTMEEIETKPLTFEEKQLKLKMEEDEHLGDMEGKEAPSTDQLHCNNCGWVWQAQAVLTAVPAALHCPSCDSPAVSLHFEEVGEAVEA